MHSIDSIRCMYFRYPNIVYPIKLFSTISLFCLMDAFTSKKTVVCFRAVLQNPMLKYYFILQPQQEKYKRFKSFPHFGIFSPEPPPSLSLFLHIFHLLFSSFMQTSFPLPFSLSLNKCRSTYLCVYLSVCIIPACVSSSGSVQINL